MISPELLRRYPYFGEVDDESLKQVAMISNEVKFSAGETIFEEGDPAENLYLLTDGEVDLQYTLGSGELRTVDTLVAGDLMVWSALVEPYKCSATGKVKKDAMAIAMAADKLRQLCENNHELGYRVLTSVAQLLATRLEGARVQLATQD